MNTQLYSYAVDNFTLAKTAFQMCESNASRLALTAFLLYQAVELAIRFDAEKYNIRPIHETSIELLMSDAEEQDKQLVLTEYIKDHTYELTMWGDYPDYFLSHQIERDEVETAMEEVRKYLEKVKRANLKYIINSNTEEK